MFLEPFLQAIRTKPMDGWIFRAIGQFRPRCQGETFVVPFNWPRIPAVTWQGEFALSRTEEICGADV